MDEEADVSTRAVPSAPERREGDTIDRGEVVDVDAGPCNNVQQDQHVDNKTTQQQQQQPSTIPTQPRVGNPGPLSSKGGRATKKAKKLTSATKEGLAALDQWLPTHVKAAYHVFKMGDDMYDAMLTRTDVENDNNEFFLIQLLEANDGALYMVYNRRGRVGSKGEDILLGPYTSLDRAVQDFEHKFYDMTKNHWPERSNFVSYPNCYTWLEMEYSPDGKRCQGLLPASFTESQIRNSALDPRVARFVALICNIRMMAQQMADLGYNAQKLPLQNLSKSTILKGYDVLKLIADVMDQANVDITGFVAGEANRKLLECLSGEFYSIIPHDFGEKKMSEFLIDSPQKLKKALEIVEALGEIEHATKLLARDEAMKMQNDPLYVQYERLRCDLVPVEADSKEYSMIERYMKNTCFPAYTSSVVNIVQIFRVTREGESDRFRKYADVKNRMLLWHGSRLTNWVGILSQGLRIAPPNAPLTGSMFGRGVYFADMFSKSSAYSFKFSKAYSSKASNSLNAVLLLSEVALGEMQECIAASHSASRLPPGKLSTKGVGWTEPSTSEELDDGVVVPLGPAVQKISSKGSLLYIEYVVYNEDQIRMRYVVHVEFNYNKKS